MSVFKINDKVETSLGIGTIVNIRFSKPVYTIRFDGVSQYIEFSHEQINQYKSAHDRLIELGWRFSECKGMALYQKNSDFIEFNTERKTYVIYSLNNHYAVIDLELSRILKHYLEELENETKS